MHLHRIFSVLAFFCLVGCLMPAGVTAQFGVGGRYSALKNTYWHNVFDARNTRYADRLGSIYAVYWFRLKEKRLEFLPEVGYYNTLNKITGTGPPNSLQAFYLQFNTDIYFLDFGDDCNCPTFSKQNDVLKRGLFLEVSPGVEFRSLSIDFVENNELNTKTFKNTVPRLFGGLGLDIGMSDLITITPIIGVSYHASTAWEGVEEFLEVDGNQFNATDHNRDLMLNAGVRIILRPDYLRRRR